MGKTGVFWGGVWGFLFGSAFFWVLGIGPIIRNGADMVFRQCLEIGFFHADPHPGNIFVLKGQKLCFIDCGMTGLIDPPTMEQLARIVHGSIQRDVAGINSAGSGAHGVLHSIAEIPPPVPADIVYLIKA